MMYGMKLSPDELPLACSLSMSEKVKRGEEVADLFKDVEHVNELVDGYACRFPGGDTWGSRLLQFITAERDCCPFFTFALVFEPKQGPIWLHIRGPEGSKEIIRMVMDQSTGEPEKRKVGNV